MKTFVASRFYCDQQRREYTIVEQPRLDLNQFLFSIASKCKILPSKHQSKRYYSPIPILTEIEMPEMEAAAVGRQIFELTSHPRASHPLGSTHKANSTD